MDVGVLLGVEPDPALSMLLLDLEGRIELLLRRQVQLVALDGAPADLVHRVLRDGVLLLDRDPGKRIQFEVRKRNEYFDLAPVRLLCRGPRGG